MLETNLTFYGSRSQFHHQLNEGYINLDGYMGNYFYYYNSENFTIYTGVNSSDSS